MNGLRLAAPRLYRALPPFYLVEPGHGLSSTLWVRLGGMRFWIRHHF